MVKSKTAFVTGASSGIGYFTAIELAKRGYKVFAGARRLEAMKPLENYGIKIIQIDVTKTEDVINAKTLIAEETGGSLDILFNNAGVFLGNPAFDVDDALIQRSFDVNVYGSMRVVREFHPLLIKSKGLIAFTGSILALIPLPFNSVYSATKAAIQAYANTLAVEVEPFGVKVLNLVTGTVDTGIGENISLSKDSLYRIDGKDIYQKNTETSSGSMSPEVYAIKAVNDFERALSSTSKNYWISYRGTQATATWFVDTFLPRSVLVSSVLKNMKFVEPFKLLREKHKL